MFEKARLICLLPMALAILACSGSTNEHNRFPIAEVQKIGIELCRWFYDYELDTLHRRFIDTDYSTHELRAFRERVARELGEELETIVEIPHVVPYAILDDGSLVYGYVRHSNFSKGDRPVRTSFTFDAHGAIFAFEVSSLENEHPTQYTDYRAKTRLRLPFDGSWYVGWGGRGIALNQHAFTPDQRFAYDFLIKQDGYTFSGNGAKNEDYYCFNREVLAPGNGEVIEVESDVPDNRRGELPPVHGNRVLIDHRNGEYSVLSHFKHGSIVVNVGDSVVAGQLLGLCGNSGYSSEPHLHYHLQDSPLLGRGNGLPAQFEAYIANGEGISRGEPEMTQIVRHRPTR